MSRSPEDVGGDGTGRAHAGHAAHVGHAVVIGAGMAGLPAARVLADHVEQVTLVERHPDRDRVPAACIRDPVTAGTYAQVLGMLARPTASET